MVRSRHDLIAMKYIQSTFVFSNQCQDGYFLTLFSFLTLFGDFDLNFTYYVLMETKFSNFNFLLSC